MAQFHISFEAINPETNLFREYSIWISKDLFGYTLVDTYWSRKGRTRGKGKRYSFESDEEARDFSLLVCRKRLKATRRIGCNYTCISHNLTLSNMQDQLDTLFSGE